MDCDDEETRLASRLQFLNVNMIEEFLELYYTFYENNLCIPFYYDTFYGMMVTIHKRLTN